MAGSEELKDKAGNVGGGGGGHLTSLLPQGFLLLSSFSLHS